MDLAIGGRVFRGFPRQAEKCLCKKLQDGQNAAGVPLSVKIGKHAGLRMDGEKGVGRNPGVIAEWGRDIWNFVSMERTGRTEG